MREEYFCPKCNAILNAEYGFDPNKGTWTCTECGAHLMVDDVYKGIAWYCDDCGALLNRQSGFFDYCGYWKCKKCEHWNPISKDNITDTDEEEESIFSALYASYRTYKNMQNHSNYKNNKSGDGFSTIIIAIGIVMLIVAFCMFVYFFRRF